MKVLLSILRAAALLLLMNRVGERTHAQQLPALPDLPGRIAYIGVDYNVYSMTLPDGEALALTDDAGMAARRTAQYYQWPTWSTDGRLAYFRTLADMRGSSGTEVYISPDGMTPGEVAYSDQETELNYAYWAPQNCAETEDCRDLALLLGSDTMSSFIVTLVRDGLDEARSVDVGAGSPFYFSWSPNGRQMLWVRDRERMDIFDAVDYEIEQTLEQVPGTFFAPAWSPVDDRLLFAGQSDNGETTDLVIVANGTARVLVADLNGSTAFSWSPNGNRIAYSNDGGPVYVIDAVSGETVARSPVSGVIAFFWSPNSESLAYITAAAQPPGSFNAIDSSGPKTAALQGAAGLAWSVLDVEADVTQRYGTFRPTREMIYLLSYFDQFAQSHRLWSPDSTHLLYSELDASDQPVISLLDTTQAIGVPLVIAEGVVGIWSFS